MADQVLHLKVHGPIDDWVLDSTVTYGWPKRAYGEVQLGGNGKLTAAFTVSRTETETSSAEVSTDFPIKTPFVDIPISVKLGHTFEQSTSSEFTASSELNAPPNAVSVVFYTQKRMDKKIGRVSIWNRTGLIGSVQQTSCNWFDPNTFRVFIGWDFKDANGSIIEQ